MVGTTDIPTASGRLSEARASVEAVREIVETELTDAQIAAFINTAHRFVESRLDASKVGEELLTEIEKYLAAHFMSLREPKARKENFGNGEYAAEYQGQTGMGLKATLYGQTAISLDPTGELAGASDAPKRAGFRVL